ncbi:hypothetical protein NPIL_485761 [Nephila pilipes]|uniref:Uncharacterized protein n=1 Tax=Nephila pilipes TaxID=299642 RepID=A0A8X6Q3M5_NEPPI|nr:hypothetical protein NPIL_490171 [Nephila pilipes]GFT16359.1 hypothetical protein NPIL_111941 [Nephila pilipes]GFT35693.1 hypothetical protein NPIL_229401 [Nephila pilipes]GFT98661.1 hypothetical protein NPIL_485761 [Nephila pilipes]
MCSVDRSENCAWKTDRRIGKGENYADLEFVMKTTMGAVSSETIVITGVHDCQVLTPYLRIYLVNMMFQ